MEKMEKVNDTVSSYIDNIIVNETEVAVEEIVAHLRKFGLIAKLLESMDGGVALGLRLKQDKTRKLQLGRGNEIPQMKEELHRWELFSICGKLTGHYPITGWLLIACSCIKRQAEGDK